VPVTCATACFFSAYHRRWYLRLENTFHLFAGRERLAEYDVSAFFATVKTCSAKARGDLVACLAMLDFFA
jgi:hypothetical protein